MLSGLTSLLKPGLELTLTGRDDQDCYIGLGGTGDHRGYIGLVAGGIKDGVPPDSGLKIRTADFDSFTLRSFLRSGIKGPTQVPTLSTGFLRFLFVFFHRPLVNRTAEIEEVAASGALASIYMSDENDVQVFLDCKGCQMSSQVEVQLIARTVSKQLLQRVLIGNRIQLIRDRGGVSLSLLKCISLGRSRVGTGGL